MSCRHHYQCDCIVALTSNQQQTRDNGGTKHPCKENSCEVATHKVRGNGQGLTGNIPLSINVAGDAEEFTVFEDYTDNHNKTFLQLSVEPSPLDNTFSVLDVRIYTRDSLEPIEVRLQTNSIGPGFIGIPRGVQVENFTRLTVSNVLDSPSVLRVYIEKTFCICCKGRGGHSL
ncbi:exosporium protein D [Sutcliffiella horikoshii]|uniref:Exosporium protein D n=1 Tax=Sutcliffiella horikoshii TaxID=79883 RepID=A0A5D4T0V3_9BACI|nr:exosporium protein D [Sutcliffiella horikoshii]TYS67726.1 exosporium protein D [Sutcliffiella horikoshii]